VDFYISSIGNEKFETEDFSVLFGMELRHYATARITLFTALSPTGSENRAIL
jgi:hypothetical protein